MSDNEELSFRDRHRFSLMIFLAIIIATVLVATSMSLYYNSGAAQLDLSRPGYKNIRAQVTGDEIDFNNFSATGSIDKEVISDFKILYSSQAQKIKAANAFSGDPLDPSALGLTLD